MQAMHGKTLVHAWLDSVFQNNRQSSSYINTDPIYMSQALLRVR
jgi:hypothetical protein